MQDGSRDSGRVAAGVEEGEVDDGAESAPFDDEEEAQQRGGCDEESDDLRARPAPSTAAVDGQNQRRQQSEEQDGAADIEAAGPLLGRDVPQQPPAEQRPDRTERDARVEQGPPIDPVDQESAQIGPLVTPSPTAAIVRPTPRPICSRGNVATTIAVPLVSTIEAPIACTTRPPNNSGKEPATRTAPSMP